MPYEYLAKRDDAELRVALVDGLRRAAGGQPRKIDRDNLVHGMFVELAPRLGVQPNEAAAMAKRLNEAYKAFTDDVQPNNMLQGEERDVARIEAMIWDLIRTGVVYPRFVEALHGGGVPWKIQWLVVTPRGLRCLAAGSLHPCQSDFAARIAGDCPGLAPEVLARIEDAQDCFTHGLQRAAIVMLGLAYEQTITVIYEAHNIEGHVPRSLKLTKQPSAKKRLDGILHVLRQQQDPPDGLDTMALHISDIIRQERNVAAHDWTRDFLAADAVEELLTLGGRNLARLWNLKQRLPEGKP